MIGLLLSPLVGHAPRCHRVVGDFKLRPSGEQSLNNIAVAISLARAHNDPVSKRNVNKFDLKKR